MAQRPNVGEVSRNRARRQTAIRQVLHASSNCHVSLGVCTTHSGRHTCKKCQMDLQQCKIKERQQWKI